MGQIKQIIREMGRSVTELRDELDKVYEGELLPDGSMPQEAADQFVEDFGKVHEALRNLREGHDSVAKAEQYFYLQAHQTIFSTIRELSNQGKSITAVTVNSVLPADIGVADMSGQAYLLHLYSEGRSASIINAVDYAEIVRDRWARRQILQTVNEAAAIVRDARAGQALPCINTISSELSDIHAALTTDSIPMNMSMGVEAARRMMDGSAGEHEQGISLPFPSVAKVLQDDLMPGQLYGLLGASGEGKTSLLLHIMRHAAEQGHPTALMSFDQHPKKCVNQLTSQALKIEEWRIRRGAIAPSQKEAITAEYNRIEALPMSVILCPKQKIEGVLSKAQAFVDNWRRKTVKAPLIVIDHIRSISPHDWRADAGSQAAFKNSAFKDWAKLNNAVAIMINQRNSQGMKLGDGQLPRPTAFDLHGGEAAKEDYDTILGMFRPKWWRDEALKRADMYADEEQRPLKFVPSAYDRDQAFQVLDWLKWLREFRGNEGPLAVRRIIRWCHDVPNTVQAQREGCSDDTILNRIDRDVAKIIGQFFSLGCTVQVIEAPHKATAFAMEWDQQRADQFGSEKPLIMNVYVHGRGIMRNGKFMGLRGKGGSRIKQAKEALENGPKRRLPWKKKGLRRHERVIAFLEWLPITKGKLRGKKMKLLPEQRDFIIEIFSRPDDNPVDTAIRSEPRGNGKTGLAAGLCLCFLLGPESEERGAVYSASIDRDMAGMIYEEMEAIILRVPEFSARTNCIKFHKRIEVLEGDGLGSVYQALSADARKAHGKAPLFWVYDEFAQAPDSELLENLQSGEGKRDHSLGMIISTQAEDDSHPFSQLIDDALLGHDPSVVISLSAAPDNADPFSEETIRACNPAADIFLDVTKIMRDAEKARRIPALFARYCNRRLNQRRSVSSDDRLVTREVWEVGAVPVDEDRLIGRTCFGGLDLSGKHDLTALVLAFPDDETPCGFDLVCRFWTPEGQLERRQTKERDLFEQWIRQGYLQLVPGNTVKYSFVAAELAHLAQIYRLRSLAYDRWRIDDFKQDLEEEGADIHLEPFGQGFKDMGPAVDYFAELALSSGMRHGQHPVLTQCVANAITTSDPAGNLKVDKAKSNKRAMVRIDGAVSTIMAVGNAKRFEEEEDEGPSVYEERGIMMVAADVINTHISVRRASWRLFENGMIVNGFLKMPEGKKLSKEAFDRLVANMADRYSGADNAGKTPLLEEGLDYKEISSSASDSQMDELTNTLKQEIGMVFDVPRPFLFLDDTSWGSGIEQLKIMLNSGALSPWYSCIEDEINLKCLTAEERSAGMFVDIDERESLRGTLKDQADYLSKALGSGGGHGWLTQNEARKDRRISSALRAIGERDLTVNINSPGGSYYSGLAIYNLLRQHPAKVTVKVLGSAGSAASVIAMAGDEILMATGANIMVHAASALVMGNRFDMSELSELLSRTDEEMAKLYAARAGVQTEIAAGWMDRNQGGGRHFYADEAIKVGLADAKLPKAAVKAEDRKTIPAERRMERALMRGEKLSANDAKALIGEIKTVTAMADLSDPVVAVQQLNAAFEEFKAAHQEELDGIKKGHDDFLTHDKLDRINAFMADAQETIDKQAAEIAALKANGAGSVEESLETEVQAQYRGDFFAWVQDGENETSIKASQRNPEIMADASVGTDADGGFTAPVEWDRTITKKRVDISPMRRYASSQNVTGQGFRRLYSIGGTSSGWVGETGARPKTNTSQLNDYAFSFGEIYANPAATAQILDDSEINFVAWLAEEVNTEVAKQEGTAYVSGDGVNKPKGFLNYTTALEAALDPSLRHPLGPIAEVNSGAISDLTLEGIIDLIYDLPEDRSLGALVFANRKTWARVRKFKDTTGQFIWQPPVAAGQPATVFGAPAVELSGMPDIAANALSMAYGNMAQTYRIFDRLGMRVLRDPYTNKPYIMFYTTMRVGGGLWNPEWMRYHKIAA
eukprot:g17209.t1